MVQYRGVRAVIDGQLHLNLVDIYIADDAIAGGIEAIIVSADLLVFRQREWQRLQLTIVFLRPLKIGGIVLRRQTLDNGVIVHDGLGLCDGVPVAADGRIQQEREARQENAQQY